MKPNFLGRVTNIVLLMAFCLCSLLCEKIKRAFFYVNCTFVPSNFTLLGAPDDCTHLRNTKKYQKRVYQPNAKFFVLLLDYIFCRLFFLQNMFGGSLNVQKQTSLFCLKQKFHVYVQTYPVYLPFSDNGIWVISASNPSANRQRTHNQQLGTWSINLKKHIFFLIFQIHAIKTSFYEFY